MNRVGFQKLARLRVREAEALFAARMYSGAYYLAGYAVECGLKACVAKLTRRHDFPKRDFVRGAYTHDYEQLIKTAQLVVALKTDKDHEPELESNWDLVKNWKEDSRYIRWSRAQARTLIDAITEVPHGVLPWIELYW